MESTKSVDNAKGIGLFSLIGVVISSCIGSGIFALTGQLAQVAAPGSVLIAWAIVGLGFLLLALSLNNLVQKRPEIKGIFGYAEAGWGPLAGFISGWGYWLSAWLGNVAFATIMMSAVGYFYPPFVQGNTPACIAIASVAMWVLTFLVINGVESASFLNALVMLAKVISLVVFVAFALALFRFNVFTADFWGTLYNNAVEAGKMGADATALGDVVKQVLNCVLIMMWVFIGVEGASVVGSRAKRKSDAGKATVLGLIALLIIYIFASVLPYGYMSFDQVAALDKPAMLYVFDKMFPGGGAFITIAMIVSVLGSWLSFTILPAETTNEMAEHNLVPKSWGKLNKKRAPQFSLLIVGLCTQVFMLTLLVSEDAYNFAFSMCTVAIVVTWALAAAFQAKFSAENKDYVQMLIGLGALIFQVVGVIFNGWSFLLLTFVGYIPGFAFYIYARREGGYKVESIEYVVMAIISALGVAGLVLLSMGVISI